MRNVDSPSTSPPLLRLLAEPGNHEAWRVFVTRYSEYILGAACQLGLDPAEADEVRTAVFEGLLSAMQQFEHDPAQRFRGYLRRAVRNAATKVWRKRQSFPQLLAPGQIDRLDLPAPIERLADELDDRIVCDLRVAERIMEIVKNEVETDTWAAYFQTALESRPAQEVARRLGKSVAAVYVAKSRVAKRLRELGGDFAGG